MPVGTAYYLMSVFVTFAKKRWSNKNGKINTACTAALNPKMTAAASRKTFNGGAAFFNIHGPAPAKIANANKTTIATPSGSQA